MQIKIPAKKSRWDISQSPDEERSRILNGPSSVVLSEIDAQHLYNFFNNFGVKIPDYLDSSIKKFEAEPSLSSQRELRIALCEYIKNDKMFLGNEIFDDFKKKASDIASHESYRIGLLGLFEQNEEI